jgi:hypothetical protein
MNAAGTIVKVECGCLVVEHSEGWGSTIGRCPKHAQSSQSHEEWCAAPFNECSCDFDGIEY